MTTIRIPTPLRPYSGGESAIRVKGGTVGAALDDLTRQHPDLRQHLFEGDTLRSFVNVYLNQEDVRFLDGSNTSLADSDTLMIVPSIAGGRSQWPAGAGPAATVDQTALKVNQAFIITLLLASFVLDAVWLAALVGFVMLLGTAVPPLSLFKRVYRHVLRPAGLLRPQVIPDRPEPHRFAQGFGGVVVTLAVAALLAAQPLLGWSLLALVILLAALNLFVGFCAGCFLYYQLHRLGVPGFAAGEARHTS